MAHTGAMAKRDLAKPFAEMVRDLVDTPTPEPATALPLVEPTVRRRVMPPPWGRQLTGRYRI